MYELVYEFIEDPGHAWLRVPLKELETYGIAKEISQYSYMDSVSVYLEEDVDMVTYLKARFKVDGDWTEANTWLHSLPNPLLDPCPVRDMASYNPELSE